jgi:apolipoprotein N-acyltransferase
MLQIGSIVLVAAGAALLAVVTRVAMPPLTWIALTLLVSGSRSLAPAAGTGLTWLAIFASLSVANRGFVPAPGALYFGIIAANAAVVTLPFVLDRIAGTRLGGVAATLVLPLALTAVEFLRARLTSSATWGSVAYTQYGFQPMMQLAAATGIWGITFLLAWTASTAEFAWRHGFAWTEVRGPVTSCAIVLLAVVAAGSLRLAFAPDASVVIRVATLNRPRDLFVPGELTHIAEGRIHDRAGTRRKLAILHDWFLDGSRREARAGAALVAWPEQNLLVLADDEPAFVERAKRLAAAERVYLAIGMGTVHPGEAKPLENKLILIDPSGAIALGHLKTRAVPGWEASVMRAGTVPPPVVATAAGRVGGAICFEADFPEVMRPVGSGQADLAVVPANDWREIKESHLQMHVFRAIENGVSIVRPAASGVSAAIDPWGRVLGQADSFAPGDRTMVAQVPVGHVATLYARCGDWFAWTAAAALLVLFAWSVLPPSILRR